MTIADTKPAVWLGYPPRPVTGGGDPGILGGTYKVEPKADGNRVILTQGTAFSRHGTPYTKDDGSLEGHWETLTDLLPGEAFDLEFFPHGVNKGKAILLDLKLHKLWSVNPEKDYHNRRLLMEEGLPQCNPVLEDAELVNDLCIVPSIAGGEAASEYYEGLKTLWELADCPDSWMWEGVVAKQTESRYRLTTHQSDNKDTWIKFRFR